MLKKIKSFLKKEKISTVDLGQLASLGKKN